MFDWQTSIHSRAPAVIGQGGRGTGTGSWMAQPCNGRDSYRYLKLSASFFSTRSVPQLRLGNARGASQKSKTLSDSSVVRASPADTRPYYSSINVFVPGCPHSSRRLMSLLATRRNPCYPLARCPSPSSTYRYKHEVCKVQFVQLSISRSGLIAG
jgi:hypothetical protein